MISRKGYYITDHLEKDYDAIVEGFRIGWVHSCLTWIHPTRLVRCAFKNVTSLLVLGPRRSYTVALGTGISASED